MLFQSGRQEDPEEGGQEGGARKAEEGRRGSTAQGGLMALTTYRKKRDFKATPEPRGKKAQSKGGDSYLIQKHAARRLHYDLRLEMDGVLKSWAVTKGPSLVPGDTRPAVSV